MQIQDRDYNMSYSIDKNNKRKDILWKRDKSRIEIFKIQMRVAYRRFDTQTRGMGLTLLLLIGVIVVINLFSFVGMAIIDYYDHIKYSSALEKACLDQTFYSWNFKSCENIGVRP